MLKDRSVVLNRCAISLLQVSRQIYKNTDIATFNSEYAQQIFKGFCKLNVFLSDFQNFLISVVPPKKFDA